MKILLVHNRAIWYRLPLFSRLAQLYDIRIIFTQESPSQLSRTPIGPEIKYQALNNYRIFPPPYPEVVAPGLLNIIAKDKYDLLILGDLLFEGWLSFLVAKAKRKPVILWSDEWGAVSGLRKLIFPINCFLKRNADACIVAGSKHKEHFIRWGAHPEGVFVSGCVSTLRFSLDAQSESERIKKKLALGNKKVVLFIGRLVKIKGVHYLIQAFGQLKQEHRDLTLLIIGDGVYRTNLETMVRAAGIENDVFFLGWFPHPQLTPYALLADVLVLPSCYEAWGLVLNEAMSVGKPVIATDRVGGAYDLITNCRNGFIVRSHDSYELYQALKQIFADPQRQRSMGLASKKIIQERFTYTQMVECFQKAIEFVVTKPRYNFSR
jgi:glycosyltransferase involved in cell wall biosynthesis